MQNAALRALKRETARRLDQLIGDGDEAFALGPDGVLWRGEAVARLVAGGDPLRPLAEPPESDLLEAAARDRLRRRLTGVVHGLLARDLAPLVRLREAPLTGAARGLAHQLVEALGSVSLDSAAAQVTALSGADRKALARLDVRFGTESVFLPVLLKPAAQRLRALLWSLRHGLPVPPLAIGRPAMMAEPGISADAFDALGYRVVGGVAVRLDILERVAAETRALARTGAAEPSRLLLSLLGLGLPAALAVMAGLARRPGSRRPGSRRPAKVNPDSPFAVLRQK
jgi:ATP-dependent RNA helicase SUPV3L1/SUV3